MSRVRIRFNYPTKRISGGELQADAIAGADFGAHGTVAYPAKELVTADLPIGAHTFTGACVLKNGKRSASASVSVTITDESAPEILLDLSAVVEE